MSDLDQFRRETRAWLEANCPPEMRKPVATDDDVFWGGRNTKFSSEAQKVWFERMRDKGWTVPDWPTQYGGGGLDPAEAKVLREEMAAINARPPLSSFGIWMLGPALLKYGTDAQKAEYLPKITAGLIRWCQGYSEPNAGSDLASLQTRAESDGDDFVITGQKIWTSYANYADWIFCLVRTDSTAKKHDGISFILFDMASKGVSTKPILFDLRQIAVLRNLLRRRARAEIACGRHRQSRLGRRQISVAARTRDDLRHGRTQRRPAARPGRRRHRRQRCARQARTSPILRGEIARFEVDEAALACAAERAIDLAKADRPIRRSRRR
jgi:Acyl-CoA dehydrogenases